MKKYKDISDEINERFKKGIRILDDVSNYIQEILNLLQGSSGDTIELIKSDLTFLKDKYTTIKEKVEKRSSEIEERANTYDEWLKPWLDQFNEERATISYDNHNSVFKYENSTYVVVVQGPDAPDGIGYCITKTYKRKITDDGKRGLVVDTNSNKYILNNMLTFVGGYWNASDYVMNSIALGVSQLSKVAPSTSNNSGTGNVDYTSALWGKIVSENDKPAEPLPPEHGVEAIAMLEDVNSKEKYMSRKDAERELKTEGYTPDEVQYALENVKVNWKERAAEYARHYYDQNDEAVSYYGSVEIFLESRGFTEEEIQYAVEHIDRY